MADMTEQEMWNKLTLADNLRIILRVKEITINLRGGERCLES